MLWPCLRLMRWHCHPSVMDESCSFEGFMRACSAVLLECCGTQLDASGAQLSAWPEKYTCNRTTFQLRALQAHVQSEEDGLKGSSRQRLSLACGPKQ